MYRSRSNRHTPYGNRNSPGGYGMEANPPSGEFKPGKFNRGEAQQLALELEPPSGPRVLHVYNALLNRLRYDNNTIEAIRKMLPGQTENINPDTGTLWTSLTTLCNHPPQEDEPIDDSAPATLRLNTEEQGEMELEPRIASQLKWAIGSFNPQSEDTMEKLLKTGNTTFELFERIMKEYSAVKSKSMDGSVSCLVKPLPSQPLDGYEQILGEGTYFHKFPFPVYFDVATAQWVKELLITSVLNLGKILKTMSEKGIKFGIGATVWVSGQTVKVGVLSLILLFNMAVKAAEEAAGRAGQIMRYIVETLFNQKELLFASPFANITNPPDDVTQVRRQKRFIMVYLYTMLKLLSVLKECENIEWLKNSYVIDPVTNEGRQITKGTPLTPEEFDRLTIFIKKDKSSWTVEEILKHGSRLFILILDNQLLHFRACPKLSNDFVELYNNSLKIQFDLLNIRLGRADYDPTELVTYETPIGKLINAINNAGDLRMIDPDTLSATQSLIRAAVEGVIKHYGGGKGAYDKTKSQIEALFVESGPLELKRDEWMGEVMSIVAEFDLPLPVSEDDRADGSPLSQSQSQSQGTDESQDTDDESQGMDVGGGMSGGAKRKKLSKKRYKKRTKKKSKKRKSGKRKAGKRKSGKHKKTKRKSMKQVKEKLINLINSL